MNVGITLPSIFGLSFVKDLLDEFLQKKTKTENFGTGSQSYEFHMISIVSTLVFHEIKRKEDKFIRLIM